MLLAISRLTDRLDTDSPILRQLSDRMERLESRSNRRSREEVQDVPVHETRIAAVSDPIPERAGADYAIAVVDRRWQKPLDAVTYRLPNRRTMLTPPESAELTKIINETRPRITACSFDGSDPVSILSFLDRFVQIMREGNRSEAIALLMLNEFLAGRASSMFRAVRSRTYVAGIYWLLTTFTPEVQLNIELDSIRALRIRTNERPSEFSIRLQERVAR
jgi:hypothetical protein